MGGIAWDDGRKRRKEGRTDDIFLCTVNQSQSESRLEPDPGLSVHVLGYIYMKQSPFTEIRPTLPGQEKGPWITKADMLFERTEAERTHLRSQNARRHVPLGGGGPL